MEDAFTRTKRRRNKREEGEEERKRRKSEILLEVDRGRDKGYKGTGQRGFVNVGGGEEKGREGTKIRRGRDGK